MNPIRGKRLTSSEAARALGVSEASIKRWADGGLLPTEKTAGGHRRFRPEDVARVRREGLGDVESGSRRSVKRGAQPARAMKLAPRRAPALVEETMRALLDGQDEELAALLVNLYLSGQTVAGIADSILCAAMRRVGDLWHAGELSVAQEHVATSTMTTALGSLKAAAGVGKEAGRDAGALALCCSVEEDYHALPVRLAALTFEAGGFEVFDLGVNTPFSALTEAVEKFRPRLVCVASTVNVGLDRAAREYAPFRRATQRRGAAVVLGGAGFAGAEVRRRFPAELHAESFRQLEEFVHGFEKGGGRDV